MTTFEEARAIVAANRANDYPPEADFQVADYGWETEDTWVMVSGPYAALYGPRSPEDYRFITTDDGPFVQVNKVTGEYTEDYGMEFFQGLHDLPQVGTHP